MHAGNAGLRRLARHAEAGRQNSWPPPLCTKQSRVRLSPTHPTPHTHPPTCPQTVANNFSGTAWAFNKLLNVVNAAHAVLGATPLKAISGALNRLSGHMVPEWNPYMPKVSSCSMLVGMCASVHKCMFRCVQPRAGRRSHCCQPLGKAGLFPTLHHQPLAHPSPHHSAQGAAPLNLNPPKPEAAAERGVPRKVVYVPACVTRIMGPARGDYEQGGCLQCRGQGPAGG